MKVGDGDGGKSNSTFDVCYFAPPPPPIPSVSAAAAVTALIRFIVLIFTYSAHLLRTRRIDWYGRRQ